MLRISKKLVLSVSSSSLNCGKAGFKLNVTLSIEVGLSVKPTVCIKYGFLATTEVSKSLIRHHLMH